MKTKPHQIAIDAEQSLREAVRDEFDRKAKLGQYVVITAPPAAHCAAAMFGSALL